MVESNAPAQQKLAPPLLQVDDLTKVFAVRRWLRRTQFVRAVRDVSLHIGAQETLGIVGESGSGKSTLARAILRLTSPSYGQIAFEGRNITELPESALRPIRRHMQPVFQDAYAALNPRQRVAEIVSEGLRIHHLSRSSEAEAASVHSLLKRVGLAPQIGSIYPGSLSAGERQQVVIARALGVKPRLLICDEPVSALDVSVQAQIVNLLLDLQRDRGLSYLFISHDINLVRFVSHRIAVMYAGQIIETGETEVVSARRAHPYTRALLNAVPEVNPRARRLKLLLEGDAPDPREPTKGCAFAARCPRVEFGTCDELAPPLHEHTPESGHFVACHYPHLPSPHENK